MPINRIKSDYGHRLKSALKEKGMTQTELAKNLGISSATVSEMLNGSVINPGIETLKRYSKAAGLPENFLYDDEPVTEKDYSPKFRQFLNICKLPVTQVAAKSGIDQDHLLRVVAGTANLSREQIDTLSATFGIPAGFFDLRRRG